MPEMRPASGWQASEKRTKTRCRARLRLTSNQGYVVSCSPATETVGVAERTQLSKEGADITDRRQCTPLLTYGEALGVTQVVLGATIALNVCQGTYPAARKPRPHRGHRNRHNLGAQRQQRKLKR